MAGIQTTAPKATNGAAQTLTEMLSPQSALAAWRSLMTLPAISAIEALRFGSQRMEAQAELLNSMLECKDIGKVFEKQSSFMRDAFKDYGRETEKLVHKVRESVSEQAKAA
jgi:hypothetical protein